MKRNFMELGARLIYMMATSTVLKDIFLYKKDPSTFILIAIKLFERLDGRTWAFRALKWHATSQNNSLPLWGHILLTNDIDINQIPNNF